MDYASWVVATPEIFLLVMTCVIALVDLGVQGVGRTLTYVLSLFTLAVVAYVQSQYALTEGTAYGFGNMVVSDPMGNWLKCFAALAVAVTLIYGRPYAADRDMLRGGELYSLSLLALLGMFVMISGNNFLVMYLGLELLTLSGYALVALRRDHAVSTEAAMKYFVLGALASGFLLYGLSMLYGATGTLDLDVMSEVISGGEADMTILAFALVFIVAGLGFKLSAVPFHMWVPDVYHGAPTAVTLFIGTAPKLAAFAFVMRLLVSGLGASFLVDQWQWMLIIMTVLSLAIGNITAIAQSNLKRMLAYSTISHAGFLLLGVLAGSGRRWLVFCDDLSFDEAGARSARDGESYRALKAVLEGGIEGRPDNVLLYATSNRRHMVPRDVIENESATAIRPTERFAGRSPVPGRA